MTFRYFIVKTLVYVQLMVLLISRNFWVCSLKLSSSDLPKFRAKVNEKLYLTLKFPKVHQKGPREPNKKQIGILGNKVLFKNSSCDSTLILNHFPLVTS